MLRVSVAVALVTIVLKGAAGYVTNSMGLISDAMESFVNLASAMFALAMVTIAARPADDDHPYGHHKAEYFSSGFEGILIIGAALAIGWAAIVRLMSPQPIEQLGWGLALSILSSMLNAGLAVAMFRAARARCAGAACTRRMGGWSPRRRRKGWCGCGRTPKVSPCTTASPTRINA